MRHLHVLLQVWLKQPLTSEEDIRVRHDVVEAIVSDPELREGLRDHHFRGQSLQDKVVTMACG